MAGTAFLPEDTWATYTPTLASNGTQPTLGTGAVLTGRWNRQGGIIHASVNLVFGTGMTPGTGTYTISLPAAIQTALTYSVLGTWYAYHAGSFAQGVATISDSTHAQMIYAGGGQVQATTTPWTWTAGDVLVLAFTYEAA